MNHIQLFINDNLVDLSDDSPIALTFQINNLAEVKNQQGNTSNQFKLPLTQRNRQILGFPDEVAMCSLLPYTPYQAKLIQDGLEIIPYGIAELNGTDQETADLTVLSGNVDFFDAIDGKLYDMGDSTSQWGAKLVWKPYDHVWNLDNVVQSQVKTEGWIWPVVDYGAISTADYTIPVDVRYQRPGFFIKTAIELLLQSAGYKGSGSLLEHPLYPLLICQFANDSFEHGTDVQNNPDIKSMTVQIGVPRQVDHPYTTGNLGEISFSQLITDPSGAYKAAYNGYFVSEITSVTASVAFNMSFFSTYTHHRNDSSKIAILILLYDDIHSPRSVAQVLATSTVFDYNDRGSETNWLISNQVITADCTLQPGQGLKIGYEFTGQVGSSFTMTSGTFSIQNKVQNVAFGQLIQCERIFPDIAQKDLLKDILQHFGIICQTDNAGKKMSFNSFKDIVANIPIANDWTAKCLNHGKAVSYKLGGYAQVNYLRYKQDDNVLPKYFADDQINISDATLTPSADLIVSQFAPTLNRPYVNGTIAQILKIEPTASSNDFTISTQPRLLVDQKYNLLNAGKTINFTDGVNTVPVNDIISVPYFYKPDGQYNLCYCDKPDLNNKAIPGLKKLYYPELQKILTQTKKVIRYFLLTPRDILELNLLIPVYLQQDNAYYYINKIDAWRKDQPTKVELIKLG
jgi:hypothetical protein